MSHQNRNVRRCPIKVDMLLGVLSKQGTLQTQRRYKEKDDAIVMVQDYLLNCVMLGQTPYLHVGDVHFLVARILNLLGYEPMELLGKTAYQFHNPADAEKIKTCHSSREYNAVKNTDADSSFTLDNNSSFTTTEIYSCPHLAN